MKSLRDVFQRWRYQTEQKSLAIELHEEGPIREQDFNYKSELRNLKDMLTYEGYDDAEMFKALNGKS